MKFGRNLALVFTLANAVALASSCESRQPKPIETPAKTPLPGTGGKDDSSTTRPPGGGGLPDKPKPDAGSPAIQPPATSAVVPPGGTQPPATQPPATQPPGTQPPATQPPATVPPTTGGTDTTNVTITTSIDGAATIQWDGLSFKGNDKWDIVPVNN